jgi:DNA-binding transcriptional regulator YdaS (Cro superfamily)
MSLKDYMSATGKKDADIAASIGVNPEVVRLWRHGRRKINAERAIELARVLGIPLHELRPDLWAPGTAQPQPAAPPPAPKPKRPPTKPRACDQPGPDKPKASETSSSPRAEAA